MTAQHMQRAPMLRLPNIHAFVGAAAGQELSGRGKGNGPYPTVVAGMGTQWPPGMGIPGTDSLVQAAAGQRRAVRAEGQRHDVVAMAPERMPHLFLFHMPDPYRPVRATGGEQLTIGAKGQGQNPVG